MQWAKRQRFQRAKIYFSPAIIIIIIKTLLRSVNVFSFYKLIGDTYPNYRSNIRWFTIKIYFLKL